MQLAEIIRTVGKPVADLAWEAQISHFRLHQFVHGRCQLRAEEQEAVLTILLAHGEKVQRALSILREVASA